jgi:hypothetical protein
VPAEPAAFARRLNRTRASCGKAEVQAEVQVVRDLGFTDRKLCHLYAIAAVFRTLCIASSFSNHNSPTSHAGSSGAEMTSFWTHFVSPGIVLTIEVCCSPSHLVVPYFSCGMRDRARFAKST